MVQILEFSKLKESYTMNVKIVTEICKYLKLGVPVSLLELLDGIKKNPLEKCFGGKKKCGGKKMLWKHWAFS